MKSAPRGIRLHIAMFGRRNVGKSSLLNALLNQDAVIVSDVAGTTTDPVEKPMEIMHLGPCLFIDTAGIDDSGDLGEKRVEKTYLALDRADLGIIVTEAGHWGTYEQTLLSVLQERNIPISVVFNKTDLGQPDENIMNRLNRKQITSVKTNARDRIGIENLRKAIILSVPEELITLPAIVGDLIPPGELVVLVVPVDSEAPKGRLILPQVQTIRDLLDNDCYCMVVKESELADALTRLNRPPALVVTDSQAFKEVAEDTPAEIPLTSFSILFARYKGDLRELVAGALAIKNLKPGDRVLIAEACNHHPIEDDIGRVKIPRWLNQNIGGKLEFEYVQGHDFPQDLSGISLVVHCGGCMNNRREMLSRIMHCHAEGVPITNYGVCIAYSLGIFERVLAPFPDAMQLCLKSEHC
jgi:[FeFe] hydrogenase H-cluster maturation GTPase HydF